MLSSVGKHESGCLPELGVPFLFCFFCIVGYSLMCTINLFFSLTGGYHSKTQTHAITPNEHFYRCACARVKRHINTSHLAFMGVVLLRCSCFWIYWLAWPGPARPGTYGHAHARAIVSNRFYRRIAVKCMCLRGCEVPNLDNSFPTCTRSVRSQVFPQRSGTHRHTNIHTARVRPPARPNM